MSEVAPTGVSPDAPKSEEAFVISSQVKSNPLGLHYPLNTPVQDTHNDITVRYWTTFQAFCACRVDDPDIRQQITNLTDPSRIARLVLAAPSVVAWDACKEFYLATLLRNRYTDPYFKQRLMASGSTPLVVEDPALRLLWEDAEAWVASYLMGLRRTYFNAIRFG